MSPATLKAVHLSPGVTGGILKAEIPFQLDSGALLQQLEIAYETYGEPDSDGTNAVLVCHALTGSAHAADEGSLTTAEQPAWWNGIIGSGRGLDTGRFFVICANILGSCYGSTGPASIDPFTGMLYQGSFPQVTVRDMVRAQRLLLEALGVRSLATVIGGSLGGMQVLEWAIMFPGMVRSVIPIATSAKHSAWCIAFDEAQRLAIESDQAWHGGRYKEQPARGLAIARMIAMISYRSRESFETKFGRNIQPADDPRTMPGLFDERRPSFQMESYLRYQGQKLVDRFDAASYICLTRAMDLHDVGAGRGGIDRALGSISARTLSIGISSDILYPASEQRSIASKIPGSAYAEIDSPHGHDAFLIENDRLNELLLSFLS